MDEVALGVVVIGLASVIGWLIWKVGKYYEKG